jgi:hypothetical protein
MFSPVAQPGRFRIPRLGCIVVAALLALASAEASSAAPDPSAPVINRVVTGPGGDNGWYRGPVNIRWDITDPQSPWTTSGCDARTISSDTAGVAVECRATSAGGSSVDSTTLSVDGTPPTTGKGQADRRPDKAGWYTHPVGITFSGTDALSGIAACTSVAYAGPDGRRVRQEGSCRDNAGNVGATRRFGLRYDATGPRIRRMRTSRRANRRGYFTRPVRVRFSGRDRASGRTRCKGVTYRGPDNPRATVTATCTDRLGNVSTRAFRLRYDATAPNVRVRGRRGHTMAIVTWSSASGDVRRWVITRAVVGRPWTKRVIYRGRRHRKIDRGLSNGVRYRYAVIAYDRAGNRRSRAVRVRPARRLLTPRGGARLTRPPLLRWTPIPDTRYYNVQLFRDRKLIYTAWPKGAGHRLPGSWEYGGAAYSLSAGRYTWVVWPGKGRPSQRRYGQRIGGRSFVIVAGAR